MGIGLRDIIKDDRDALVRNKQKRTLRMLFVTAIIVAILIAIVVGMIIYNSIKNKRDERIQLISKDVVNISNVVKTIGQKYSIGDYNGELIGKSLSDEPFIIKVNGKEVEYRYGYYYLTSEEVARIGSEINVKGEDYIVNYKTGDVISVKGVEAAGNKKYYSMEDIIAIAKPEKPKDIKFISNVEEMKLLASNPSGIFYLNANIDMSDYSSGEGWQPVDNFSGIFDGRGYTISNLSINRPTTVYCGLFGRVNSSAKIMNVIFDNPDVRGGDYTGTLAGSCSGEISNIIIKNGSVNSQDRYVGGLAGAFNENKATDCTLQGVYINASGSVGGLFGRLLSGTVKRCGVGIAVMDEKLQKNKSNKKDELFDPIVRVVGTDFIGGLIGEITPNESTTVVECFANASITGQNNVGGLIGNIQINNRSTLNLSDCYSEGDIVGGRDCVGGSIGNVYTVNNSELIIQSIYTATDTPTAAIARGGFAGKTRMQEGTNIQWRNCCFEKEDLIDGNVADIGDKEEGVKISIDSKNPAQMKSRVTYADWNFDLWTLEEGISRPHLRWEYEEYK